MAQDQYEIHVCPGCYAVGGEPCAPYCIDAELAREREEGEPDWECSCGQRNPAGALECASCTPWDGPPTTHPLPCSEKRGT